MSTPGMMFDVLVAVAPVFAAAVWYFGTSALLVVAAATLGCVAAERAWGKSKASWKDGSAALTGVLLGLTLPPGLPLWMAFLGGLIAIGLGKIVWGGLGQNLFNPALVGRATLQAAFPTAMTTWTPQGAGMAPKAGNLAAPFMQATTDGVSAATPLAQWKFEHAQTPFMDLLTGNTAGSLGETSAGLLLLAAAWLIFRRTIDWRIPTAIAVGVALPTGILYAIDPAAYPPPHLMLGAGGLLFGAVFMATDPVTSPLAPKGAWIFGLGIGGLVALIRIFGGLPEGVMYAILLMNAASPLIERVTQPRAFGYGKAGKP
ncbi:MAG: RnfABCDGE type electron transport complex subunit D [Myxococcales bacterium]|nr:RnfABCDGE type electron transport complex subunit D [Myxococcales bacterium]